MAASAATLALFSDDKTLREGNTCAMCSGTSSGANTLPSSLSVNVSAEQYPSEELTTSFIPHGDHAASVIVA